MLIRSTHVLIYVTYVLVRDGWILIFCFPILDIQQLASVRIRILWDQIPVFVEIKIMLALTASSKDNPSKPVPECQTVLDYAAATEMMEAAMVTARTLKMFKNLR